MANNPYNNKVQLSDGTVLIDLSSDTITAADLLSGVTAHNRSGAAITGTQKGFIYYGTCSTAAATQAKAVTIDGITSLYEGLCLRILFTNAQSYNGVPTLNVNSLGAKNIYRESGTAADNREWAAGDVVDFVYDGTKFISVDGGLVRKIIGVEGCIAYVEPTVIASRTYYPGDYIFLTEYNILYRVNAVVSQGASYSSSVDRTTIGEEIAIRKDSINFTIQNTTYTMDCKKQGAFASITLNAATGKNYTETNSWDTVATLPTEFRPSDTRFLLIIFNNSLRYMRIKADGNVSIGGIPAENNVYLHFSLVYPL